MFEKNINKKTFFFFALFAFFVLFPLQKTCAGGFCGDGTTRDYNLVEKTEIFTTAGAGTWVVPIGVTSVQVEGWGGGGSGGNAFSGGGGGGGAYARVNAMTVIPGSSITYTVGSGGAGNGSSLTDNPGGSTVFNLTSLVAEGGRGSSSGLGGTITASIGDVKYAGGSGYFGYAGGGGGSGGSASNGNNASGSSGAIAVLNGGPGGNGGITNNNGFSPSSGPGGGAGSGQSWGSTSGYSGQLKLTYLGRVYTGDSMPAESCDYADLGTGTCENQSFYAGGGLSCNSECTFNISQCNPCGDNSILSYDLVPTVEIITTPGAGNWVVPAGATTVKVEAWGGGGGGSGGAGSTAWPGAGGGGGAYARVNALSVTPGASIPYEVGGAGGASNPNIGGASAGGTTKFNTNSVIAVGGGLASYTWAAYPPPGLGGAASASTGDDKFSGGSGGTNGGSGGGSAWSGGNGGYYSAIGDGGPGGLGGADSSILTPFSGRSPVSGPGGGGGGARGGVWYSDGANGAPGQLKLTYLKRVYKTTISGETCDGTNLGGQMCSTQGYTAGTLSCNSTCNAFEYNLCTYCGNYVKETGEVCDNSDLNNKTCSNYTDRIFTGISAELSYTCANTQSGEAYCWGLNAAGQLGDNTLTNKLAPTRVKGVGGVGTLNNVAGISTSGISGYDSTCAYTTAGEAYCWGKNDYRQLGDLTNIDRPAPVQVKGVGGVGTLANVAGISIDSRHACAFTTIADGGKLYCWGDNTFGQLGQNNTTSYTNGPVQVKGKNGIGFLTNVAGISAGRLYTCAYTTTGEAYCWGYLGFSGIGWAGDGNVANHYAPNQVKGVDGVGTLTNIAGISAGQSNAYSHVCAYTTIADGGKLYCWGYGAYGMLGQNNTTNYLTPVQVMGINGAGTTLTNVVGVSAGAYETCAYTTSGAAYCWGYNITGQLGDNSTTNRFLPTQVIGVNGTGTLTNVAGISIGNNMGNEHTCAFDTAGLAYCWGYNSFGQLGDGSTTNTTKPKLIPNPTSPFNNGNLQCNLSCSSYDTSACYSQICGNNIKEGTETCDGTALNSQTCATQGFAGGTLSCNAGCGGFNTTACYRCGDSTVNAGEQCDQGNIINGDGCNSACQIESGYSCAFDGISSICTLICGNGVLNTGETCDQGSGNITNGDGCNSACLVETGYTCSGTPSSCVLSCGNGVVVFPETCDQGSANSPPTSGDGCSSTCLTESGYACVGTPSVCSPTCGNGIIVSPETCDQGNLDPAPLTNGDGCSTTCQKETGYVCIGTPSVCSLACGNGIIAPPETCDQGAANSPPTSGDGCSNTCLIESTHTCVGTPSVCTPKCGNGTLNPGEQCDQGGGNIANLDGCSSTCQIEVGYTCTGLPSVCTSACGNNILNAGEICDTGSLSPNRIAPCTTGAGYTGTKNCAAGCLAYETSCTTTQSCGDSIKNGPELCDTVPNPCVVNNYNGTQNCLSCVNYSACIVYESCGDGKLNGIETCDDGNSANPGCSSTCQIETGYACTNPGGPNQISSCALTCGTNGVVDSGEICDPSNTGTATANCNTATGYPGTQSCLPNCTGYGACATNLSCGDGTLTNPPEICEINTTTSCVSTVGAYNGQQTCASTCASYDACIATERCGDHILNGDEECDYDAGPGCAADCTVEEGYFCSGIDPNICVFSCGNEVPEADKDEQCDEGTAGKINAETEKATTAPFNGEVCDTTAYGTICNWCDNSCQIKTAYGSMCGDSEWNDGSEECDDGNFISGDGCSGCEDGGYITDGNGGCSLGCKREFGFQCVNTTFSVCSTRCGDGECALASGRESCLTCTSDCGLCPIGKKPTLSALHDQTLFTSLFQKLKTFLIQPTLLIQIPGLNLGEEKVKEEFIPPPPPISKTYEQNQPTTVKIGDEYYTVTVKTVDPDGTVSFSVR